MAAAVLEATSVGSEGTKGLPGGWVARCSAYSAQNRAAAWAYNWCGR
jgi:hypothetical protein